LRYFDQLIFLWALLTPETSTVSNLYQRR